MKNIWENILRNCIKKQNKNINTYNEKIFGEYFRENICKIKKTKLISKKI